jgi:ribosomal protein L16 Arg81 hydroxylase
MNESNGINVVDQSLSMKQKDDGDEHAHHSSPPPPPPNKKSKHEEVSNSFQHSLALESILVEGDTTSNQSTTTPVEKSEDYATNQRIEISNVKDFFNQIWQHQPKLFKSQSMKQVSDDTLNKNDTNEKRTKMHACPLERALSMGWDGIASILENSRQNFKSNNEIDISLRPLFFQSQCPIQQSDLEQKYDNNPFAGYLDGCSIIQNHTEYFSEPLFALCQDLQMSFPHVYCNTYLTPPNSKTVKAHADDRDVFVVQIKGKKKWSVYRDVPIQYPYASEQVGKNGIPVPSYVTTTTTTTTTTANKNGIKSSSSSSLSTSPSTSTSTSTSRLLIDTILNEGDVLYMPRGYVHEASTTENCNNEPSFHVTIAIMTSDWSYSKTVSDMIRKRLDMEPKFRMAIPTLPQDCDFVGKNQSVKSILDEIKKCISVEDIVSELETKYELHNKNALQMRNKFKQNECNDITNDNKNMIVGPTAATLVTMKTRIRASTQMERESVASGDRGLTVREDISDALLSIAAHMKKHVDSSFVVGDLKSLIEVEDKRNICDLTLCSFVKCCVSLGVLSICRN